MAPPRTSFSKENEGLRGTPRIELKCCAAPRRSHTIFAMASIGVWLVDEAALFPHAGTKRGADPGAGKKGRSRKASPGFSDARLQA